MINLEVMKLWTDSGCECGSGQAVLLRAHIAPNKKSYDRSVIHQRIKEGAWLILNKRQIPHGEFKAFVKNEGIGYRLGNKLMQVSRVFLDECKLRYPRLESFDAWANNPELTDCINSFIGPCNSWKALLEERYISV